MWSVDKIGSGANRTDHRAKDVLLVRLEMMGKFDYIEAYHEFSFSIEIFCPLRLIVGYELNGIMERPIHIEWEKKDNMI